MKTLYMAALLAGILVVLAGCITPSIPPGGSPGAPSGSTVPTLTFTPGATEGIPLERAVTVSIAEKDPIYNTLDVTFAGGNGQVQVKDIDVLFTGSDGTTQTKKLTPVKGEAVTFQGTKGTDRVVVYVNYYDGSRYKVIDQPVPTRTREPAFTRS